MSRLARDVLVDGDPVAVDSATSVLMCSRMKDVKDLAAVHGKEAYIVSFEESIEDDLQLQLLEGAVKRGEWFVLTPAASFDFIRQASLRVLPRSVYDCNQSFRLFYVASRVDDEALSQLPALLRSGLMHVQAPMHHELLARWLCHAVETGKEYYIDKHKEAMAYLSWNDQVALCKRCTEEATMLTVLQHADIDAVNTEGERLLDVALEKRYQKAVQAICDAGGKSDLVDLPQLSAPETQHLLDTIVNSAEVPFDPVAATHIAASLGDQAVLRALFSARLDKGFAYTDYPLVEVILREDHSTTQLIIDRMECVGLHPFRCAEISLHYLVAVLQGGLKGSDAASAPPPPPSAQPILGRFCDCILEDGALPYTIPRRCIENALASCPDVVDRVLRIADVTQDPSLLMGLCLSRLPEHHLTLDCLKAYMMMTSPEGTERRELTKQIIYRGPKALWLIPEAMKYLSNRNAMLDAFVFDGDDVVGEGVPGFDAPIQACLREEGTLVGRTLLMLACSYPGYPEAAQVLLEEGCDPNIKNELGMNILQQLVVSACAKPLKYKVRLPVFGEIFKTLISRGADVSVTGLKDFGAPSLLAHASRLHLAPLCYQLLPQDPAEVRRRFFDWPVNMRCCLVTQSLRAHSGKDMGRAARGASAEEMLAAPFLPKPTHHTCNTLAPLATAELNYVLQYVDGDSLCRFSRTSAYHYGLTCRDALWMQQDAVVKRGGAAAYQCPSPVFSARCLFLHLAAGQLDHVWIEGDSPGEVICFLTGEVVQQS